MITNGSIAGRASNTSRFGNLVSIINNLVTESCGICANYAKSAKRISTKPEEESVLEYPIRRASNSKPDAYGTFIPVIVIPGVLVITRKPGGPSEALTRVVTNSILEAWPLFVITILTAFLAGIVVWFLVSRHISPPVSDLETKHPLNYILIETK